MVASVVAFNVVCIAHAAFCLRRLAVASDWQSLVVGCRWGDWQLPVSGGSLGSFNKLLLKSVPLLHNTHKMHIGQYYTHVMLELLL